MTSAVLMSKPDKIRSPAEIPVQLVNETNVAVLRYLADKSAHSDICEPLNWARKELPDTRLYCPDWHSYLYVLAYTHDTVFAFAIGMDSIGVRLPPVLWNAAGEDGGCPCDAAGLGWTTFKPFDRPTPDIQRWLKAAYDYARNPDARTI